MTQFQVRRNNFLENRIVQTTSAALSAGQIRVRIEGFSYTANNITYALMGDRLKYWQFFHAAGTDAEGWGVIPVWGFAQVIESNATDIAVGERLFGYFPPADEYIMEPTNINPLQFIEGSDQRSSLPIGYNMYRRLQGEAGYNPAFDRERMLFFPLHITSFFIWDQQVELNWHGAEQVVFLSASSKTASGLAYAMQQDENAPPCVGLTSTRNVDQVKAIGWYNQTYSYDNLEQIDKNKPTTIIDFSGHRPTLAHLYQHLGDKLQYLVRVGLTHWTAAAETDHIPTDRQEVFFAPAQIQKRIQEWGFGGYEKRTTAFLMKAAAASRQWIDFEEISSLEQLTTMHISVAKGQIDPSTGLIVRLS